MRVRQGGRNCDTVPLAVIASLIGAFYYLRVVKVMYFDEPTHEITVTGSGLADHLFDGGEAWLIISDLAEHLGFAELEDPNSWMARMQGY